MTMQSSTKEKDTHIRSIHIPKSLQKEWKKAFTKKLYCIGKDIKHKDNLLLQYGFTRQRPPNPDKGSSQYSFTEQDFQVIMWGFGMMFAAKNDDGLFLWRHEFEPKFLKVNSLLPNLWDPDQPPERTIPKTPEETLRMLQLLIESMRWLESYEEWVLATCGQSYRNKSLQGEYSSESHHNRLDKDWHELSEKFAKILETSEPELNQDAVESKDPQSEFEQSSQKGKKVCGACGENYPEEVNFCPSCGWEDLPC